MFFCTRCGNSKNFYVNVNANIEVSGMSEYKVLDEITISNRHVPSCVKCARSDYVRTLERARPREVLDNIIKYNFSPVSCRVDAYKKAKAFFIEHAPYAKEWIEAEIIDEVLVREGEVMSRASIQDLATRQVNGIYAYFIIT